MSLFDSPLPKAPGPVRTALKLLIGKIRQTIECVVVRNNAATPLPLGTVVSYYKNAAPNEDLPEIVRPSTDAALGADLTCNQQYAGVMEVPLAAGTPASPTPGIARHDGGPVFVLLDAELDPHVGDSLWATGDPAGGYCQVIGTITSPNPIYVGMVTSITGYEGWAPPGTTGVYAMLKHAAPPNQDPG